MADCYFHGYSGGPGECFKCAANVRAGRAEDEDEEMPHRVSDKPAKFTPSGKPRWNNDELYAGSPMYYYCTVCGDECDIVPENYDPRVRQPKHKHDTCALT